MARDSVAPRRALPPALPLLLERLAHPLELPLRGLVDAREAQVELLQCRDDNRADHDPREPLVIGGHDVPWRMRACRMADDILIDRLIAAPERALGDVVHGKLPVLFGLFKPLEKALALLFPGKIEEELYDDSTVARQIPLEAADILEALAPDVLGDQFWREFFLVQQLRMHPRHQALLVVGAIEDADAPALGQRGHAAPHEIVIELVHCRLLERGDLAALRVHALENRLDRGVLAR